MFVNPFRQSPPPAKTVDSVLSTFKQTVEELEQVRAHNEALAAETRDKIRADIEFVEKTEDEANRAAKIAEKINSLIV